MNGSAKPLLEGLSRLFVAALLFFVLPHGYAAEGLSPGRQAEQWEEAAKLRLQAARGHEMQAARRREEMFTFTDILPTPGDALDSAGDEKYSASEDYQRASKNWENAAKAFKTAGEPDKAKDALQNAAMAWEAARRTLGEGTELYKMAEERFEIINDLDKKTKVVKKSARNIERLMEMK